MKYQTIENIYQKLDTIKNVSFKIQIALLKNKSLMGASFQLIQDIKKNVVSDSYMIYHKELMILYDKYCTRLSNGSYAPREECKETFVELYKNLNLQYSDVIQEFLENERLFKEFLNESVELPLITYSLDDLPDDLSCLNKDETDVLFEFINN